MVKLYHAFPFARHEKRPVDRNADGEFTGGNVFEGVDSCFFFDEPGPCSLFIACSVGISQTTAETCEFIRTTVFHGEETIGEETLPFNMDGLQYRRDGEAVCQWIQEISFVLEESTDITCRFAFANGQSEEPVDGALRVLIQFHSEHVSPP